MEDRNRLPGQLVARQDYIPNQLLVVGDVPIHTLLIKAEDEATYDSSGRIWSFRRYGEADQTIGILEPGTYAWRIRDATWEGGDKAAYQPHDGHNTELARTELATQGGLAFALHEMGLGEYGIARVTNPTTEDWVPGELVLVKPQIVSDIADVSKNPSARAHLIPAGELGSKLAEATAGGIILQRPEQVLAATDLLDQLGISTDSLDPEATYLHALRVFAPLWSPSETPAVELRLTDARTDVGKRFATKLQLVEPELVFDRLPGVARLDRLVRPAFANRYGEQNYLAFDYVVRSDGTAKLANALVRPLTPNLEHQLPEVQHLANATADVEVRQIARTALRTFAAL